MEVKEDFSEKNISEKLCVEDSCEGLTDETTAHEQEDSFVVDISVSDNPPVLIAQVDIKPIEEEKEIEKENESTLETKIEEDVASLEEKESHVVTTEVSDDISQETPSVQCETTVSSDIDSIAKLTVESEPDLKVSNEMEVMEESQSSEVSQKESLTAPGSDLIDSVDAASEQESQMDLSPYVVDVPNESSSEGIEKNSEKCSVEIISDKEESKTIELSMKSDSFHKGSNIDEDWEIIKVDPNSENSTDIEQSLEKDTIIDVNKLQSKDETDGKKDDSYYQQMLYQQGLKEDEAALLAAAWDVVESSEFQDITLHHPVSKCIKIKKI